MKNKKVLLIYVTIAVLVVGSPFIYRCLRGYWPIPELLKRLYYITQNQEQKLDTITIDRDFRFFEKGYSCSTKIISNSCPLPHFVILDFQNTKKKIPVDYVFKGKIQFEFIRENKTVLIQEIKQVKNVIRYENQKPSYTYCFNLTRIPFPLAGKTYNGLTVKVTVIEPDEYLREHADAAIMVLSPDLIL